MQNSIIYLIFQRDKHNHNLLFSLGFGVFSVLFAIQLIFIDSFNTFSQNTLICTFLFSMIIVVICGYNYKLYYDQQKNDYYSLLDHYNKSINSYQENELLKNFHQIQEQKERQNLINQQYQKVDQSQYQRQKKKYKQFIDFSVQRSQIFDYMDQSSELENYKNLYQNENENMYDLQKQEDILTNIVLLQSKLEYDNQQQNLIFENANQQTLNDFKKVDDLNYPLNFNYELNIEKGFDNFIQINNKLKLLLFQQTSRRESLSQIVKNTYYLTNQLIFKKLINKYIKILKQLILELNNIFNIELKIDQNIEYQDIIDPIKYLYDNQITSTDLVKYEITFEELYSNINNLDDILFKLQNFQRLNSRDQMNQIKYNIINLCNKLQKYQQIFQAHFILHNNYIEFSYMKVMKRLYKIIQNINEYQVNKNQNKTNFLSPQDQELIISVFASYMDSLIQNKYVDSKQQYKRHLMTYAERNVSYNQYKNQIGLINVHHSKYFPQINIVYQNKEMEVLYGKFNVFYAIYVFMGIMRRDFKGIYLNKSFQQMIKELF